MELWSSEIAGCFGTPEIEFLDKAAAAARDIAAVVCLRGCRVLAYPDEPSHFVGAVLVRDWLVSGRWFAPLEFARNYYDHYPFFAVGYWPPLFSIVTGLWLLVAGVGRLQALLIPAVFAAGTD